VSNNSDAEWFESGKWHTGITPLRNDAKPGVSVSWQVVSAAGIPIAKGLTEKNATLMAAAPGMLADFQTLAIVVRSEVKSDNLPPASIRTIRKIVHAAIANAKGEWRPNLHFVALSLRFDGRCLELFKSMNAALTAIMRLSSGAGSTNPSQSIVRD
jgi:hypothetical protein